MTMSDDMISQAEIDALLAGGAAGGDASGGSSNDSGGEI